MLTIGVFEIGIWELCLLGVLLLAFAYEVYFYARYMWVRDASRKSKVESRKQEEQEENAPGVSVIVCARNEGYNLKPYIQSLLTQDYPLFEVIVVNDGSEDDTQAVIDEYAALDKR
ncbi:MAG: glycosyltransferase, partial [Paludibacteraceae bacterium]|nr:glycosyltransferase [Paludibacteraceae bacterium]